MRAILKTGRVFGGPVASVLVAAILAPAVVHNHFVPAWRFIKEPGEQLLALPIFGGHFPLAVAEDNRRLVAGDDILELWGHMLGDIARAVLQPERVEPFVERIIEAELQPPGSGSLGQLAQEIALRTNL